ncbi:BON domain-containing protein [Undibacterium sp.]|jgi:hyperosmotically inducible protein|uniref:BON domain-containing protein n=1 Tax=Undibacterium sp. TaxID=1914977 RepID=UPI002C994014|nr:BON domain-containing protein [Undibacterium sp.]HTD05099.1 BON domain-containing protein [Undibacterium sp.]
MKTLLATSCFVISAILSPVISHAQDSDADRAHPMNFVKDSVITSKIKAKLAAEHITSVGRIKVDTDDKGVVWLSGTARTQMDADKAVSIAKKTEGVASVKSNIVVKAD